MAKSKVSPAPNPGGDSAQVASAAAPQAVDGEDRLLKYFECGHLPPPLKEIAEVFRATALCVARDVDPGPERSAGLRRLLEAKDCCVRARLHPGG